MLAGAGADVHEPVRVPHDIDRVFDDEQAVSASLEPVEDIQKRCHVLWVKACGWFIEDIDDAEQVGAELCGEPDSLQLATRQGRGGST